MNKKFYQAGTSLAVLTIAAQSFASPSFPNAVREAGGMTCTPSCLLCHNVDPGVSGTVDKAFGVAMQDTQLLVVGDPDSIADAYAALSETLDSDSDGTPDKAELQEQNALPSDPNSELSTPGEGPTICAGEVLYGCGAQIAQSKESPPWVAWSLLLAIGGAIAWRVRRHSLLLARPLRTPPEDV